MPDQNTVSQTDVAGWFDETYRRRGLRYLRPPDAYPIFLQLLGVQPGRSLLDIACGPGLLLQAARMRGLVARGVDISRVSLCMAREAHPGETVVQANAERLPFADGAFDYITCIGALERFLDRDRVLAEVRRVCADGGRLCFMVRNSATWKWLLWSQWLGQQNLQGHQDALPLEEWHELFRDNGFEIEEVFVDQWQRQRLRKVLRGFRPHDFRRPEPVARPLLGMGHANEFILLLRKREGNQ